MWSNRMVYMPRTRFHQLPPDRRHALIEAAGQQFAAAGFAGASLNRILEQAGLSKGVAYYYFEDKADLFATVVEHAWGEGGGDLDLGALDRDSFWPALEAMYLRQQRAFASRPWLGQVVRAAPAAMADPAAGPALQARFAPMLEGLNALLARARELGVLRQDLPEALVVAMIRGLDEAMDRWLAEHPKAGADDALLRRAFASLRAVAGGGS